MRTAVILATLLASACAPPEHLDTRVIRIHKAPPEQITGICTGLTDEEKDGCAAWGRKRCAVWLPDTVQGFDRLTQHEIQHCFEGDYHR